MASSSSPSEEENGTRIFTLGSTTVKGSDEDRPGQSIQANIGNQNQRRNRDADHRGRINEDEDLLLSEIRDLLHWRDHRKTGIVFASLLFILLNMALFSVLNVVVYLSLTVLVVTFIFRVYKHVLRVLRKYSDVQPFQSYLDRNIAISPDDVRGAVENVLCHVNCLSREFRRLFLIEDMVDSLKFGFYLWLMTYIASWFSGFTLVILGVVAIFTFPKLYGTFNIPAQDAQNKKEINMNTTALITNEQMGKEIDILQKSNSELRKKVAELTTHLAAEISELKMEYNYKLERSSNLTTNTADYREIIAFSAFKKNTLSTGSLQTIVFEGIRCNIGGAYDPENGTFTAPVNGTTSFLQRFCQCDMASGLYV